jgi:hypothetical protein
MGLTALQAYRQDPDKPLPIASTVELDFIRGGVADNVPVP